MCSSYNNSMTPICFLFKALWETKQTFLCYMGVDSACISGLSGGKDFQCSWLVKMIRLATLSIKAVTMLQIYAERISPQHYFCFKGHFSIKLCLYYEKIKNF